LQALDLDKKERVSQSELSTSDLDDVRVPPITDSDAVCASTEQPGCTGTEQQLQSMLSTIKSLSAKEEMIKNLRFLSL